MTREMLAWPRGWGAAACHTRGACSLQGILALPGARAWRLTRLSSLPRVLRQILGAEQPLHPRQEAPAGCGSPEEQVSGVQLRPALCLQAQHEGPRAQAAPPAPRWAPGGRGRGCSCSLRPGRPARGHGCLACTPASAGATPTLLPATRAPPAWPGQAGLLKLALTSSYVPSCPSGCSCPALPRTAVGSEQTVPGQARGQSANSGEPHGGSAQGQGRPAPRRWALGSLAFRP